MQSERELAHMPRRESSDAIETQLSNEDMKREAEMGDMRLWGVH
jgi:hypothetical protein